MNNLLGVILCGGEIHAELKKPFCNIYTIKDLAAQLLKVAADESASFGLQQLSKGACTITLAYVNLKCFP